MTKRSAAKPGLTVERIVEAAAAVADREGLPGVSMRSVGRELGVEAMSLYHHVEAKEALLDHLADWLMAQIEHPVPDGEWRTGLGARARSSRALLAAHPWGSSLLESRRSPGPAVLAGHEAVLAALRAGGFSVRLAGHAFSVLDAYVYGFVGTEQQLPFEPGATLRVTEDGLAAASGIAGPAFVTAGWSGPGTLDVRVDVVGDELAVLRLRLVLGDGVVTLRRRGHGEQQNKSQRHVEERTSQQALIVDEISVA